MVAGLYVRKRDKIHKNPTNKYNLFFYYLEFKPY